LSRQARYTLDQEKIEQNKGSWNQASALALRGQEDAKKAFFIDAIRPNRAVAFALQPQPEALKTHPELADAFKVLRQAEQYFSTKLPAIGQKAALAQVRAHIQNRLDAGKTGDFRESWENRKNQSHQKPQSPKIPNRTSNDKLPPVPFKAVAFAFSAMGEGGIIHGALNGDVELNSSFVLLQTIINSKIKFVDIELYLPY
jgi:hypothetical protein